MVLSSTTRTLTLDGTSPDPAGDAGRAKVLVKAKGPQFDAQPLPPAQSPSPLVTASTVMLTLAVSFIVLRVVYIALYLADRQMARSLVWLLGLLCCVALLFASWF